MRDRVADVWWRFRAQRRPAELLVDLWMLSIIAALFVGFLIGWASRG